MSCLSSNFPCGNKKIPASGRKHLNLRKRAKEKSKGKTPMKRRTPSRETATNGWVVPVGGGMHMGRAGVAAAQRAARRLPDHPDRETLRHRGGRNAWSETRDGFGGKGQSWNNPGLLPAICWKKSTQMKISFMDRFLWALKRTP